MAAPLVLSASFGSCLAVPLANRPDSERMFRSELNLFRFMPDHKAVALEQAVFHLLRADLDVEDAGLARPQHRAAEHKPKNDSFASTGRIHSASRRPLSVSGMSVVPVCCPLRLHAVSPCLIANRFTPSPAPSGGRPTSWQCFWCHDSSSAFSLGAARHLRQVLQPFERACR
jgi:hypothetical protein